MAAAVQLQAKFAGYFANEIRIAPRQAITDLTTRTVWANRASPKTGDAGTTVAKANLFLRFPLMLTRKTQYLTRNLRQTTNTVGRT